MKLSDILNQVGEDRENYYNAVSPPVILSSNFCFPDVKTMREKLEHELETPFYTRGYNPTVAMLRKKIAALEKGEDALIFSSGSAAIASAVMSVVKAGDHVVCVEKPYSWTSVLIGQYLSKYGVSSTFVDGKNAANIIDAILPSTRLIYLESPNSLTFEMQDFAAITAVAKAKNITTIADNSYCSPVNQNPLELGVDIVVHSATKYLNGHSDVVAGVAVSSKARIAKMMAEEYMTIGSIIGAHDAWLILRGLRTLELRVNRSSTSAQKIVDWLSGHEKIEKINYPFSTNNPQIDLAKKQMKQGGGLFSFLLKANDVAAVERFCNSLEYFLIATSWGGHESLCFPMCALRAAESFKHKTTLPWNLVRLYIGLEDPDELIADIKQALEKV